MHIIPSIMGTNATVVLIEFNNLSRALDSIVQLVDRIASANHIVWSEYIESSIDVLGLMVDFTVVVIYGFVIFVVEFGCISENTQMHIFGIILEQIVIDIHCVVNTSLIFIFIFICNMLD